MPYVVSLDATTMFFFSSTVTVEFSPATMFTVPTGALSLLRLIIAPPSVFAATEVVYSGTLIVDLIVNVPSSAASTASPSPTLIVPFVVPPLLSVKVISIAPSAFFVEESV